jgi:hypothetical protein
VVVHKRPEEKSGVCWTVPSPPLAAVQCQCVCRRYLPVASLCSLQGTAGRLPYRCGCRLDRAPEQILHTHCCDLMIEWTRRDSAKVGIDEDTRESG